MAEVAQQMMPGFEEDPETGEELPPPRIYEAAPSIGETKERVKMFVERFNDLYKLNAVDIVLFDDALFHFMRICRIMRTPRGSALPGRRLLRARRVAGRARGLVRPSTLRPVGRRRRLLRAWGTRRLGPSEDVRRGSGGDQRLLHARCPLARRARTRGRHRVGDDRPTRRHQGEVVEGSLDGR